MSFLMKSQRAMLHEVLRGNKFDPEDFEIVPTTARAASHERGEAVRLKNSEYYFGIYPEESEWHHEKFFVEYSPGLEQLHQLELCYTWDIVCYTFAKYLSYLAREVQTEDPWVEAEKFSEAVRSLPDVNSAKAPVDGAERDAIWKALVGIQTTLLEHANESVEKRQFIEEQFQTLKDAASKFGKKDYLMLVYTTVIGIATMISIPPNAGLQILQTLKNLIGGALQLM